MKKSIKLISLTLALLMIFALCACGQKESAADTGKATVKIGIVEPLSGFAAAYGIPEANAMKLAIEHVNGEDGFQVGDTMVKFEAVSYDAPDVKESVNATNKLVDRDEVQIIGGWCHPSGFLAAREDNTDEELLWMVGTAAVMQITGSGYDNVFRVRPPGLFTIDCVPRYMYETLGVRNLALIGIFANESYNASAEALQEGFEALGGKICCKETFSSSDTDLYTQVTSVLASEPDAIFVLGTVEQAAFIHKQAKELGYTGIRSGLVGGSASQYLAICSAEYLEGVYDFRPVEGSIEVLGEKAKAFHDEYVAKFGEEPNPNAIYGYEQIIALAAAMQQAGTYEDMSAIKDALRALPVPEDCVNGYAPVDGGFMFDKCGQAYTYNCAFQFVSGDWKYIEELPSDPDAFTQKLIDYNG